MTATAKAIFTAACMIGVLMGGVHAASLKAGSSRPPVGPTNLANPGAVSEDKYCQNGHATFPACDKAFADSCKKGGGTMSGQQGWGGKTCWEPS